MPIVVVVVVAVVVVDCASLVRRSVGLRGSFDTASNLRVFFDQQVLQYDVASSLFDVVLLVFLRTVLVWLQVLLRKSFSTVPTLVAALLFLVFVAAKTVVFATSTRKLSDKLQWAILFIASGYALLGAVGAWFSRSRSQHTQHTMSTAEILMALIGRSKGLMANARRETEPLLELFSVASTLPADRLAAKDSHFTLFSGVLVHFKYRDPPSAPPPPPTTLAAASSVAVAVDVVDSSAIAPTTTTTTSVDDAPRATTATSATLAVPAPSASAASSSERPLVVMIHGTGGCAETFVDLIAELPQRCGLSVVAVDRPGWGDERARALLRSTLSRATQVSPSAIRGRRRRGARPKAARRLVG